ncbi:MAG: DUF1349 domain-containing protein [Xenococcaceae cyanobacterium]
MNWQWFNEPSSWRQESDRLTLTTSAKSDFWRTTHYNFIHDDGNFYYREVTGNFVAEVKIIGQYQALYDQAGLMIRLDERNWLKCGIEFVDGMQQASVVVTREYSDWSVIALSDNLVSFWVRLKRRNETIEVEYSLDGKQYQMLRLAYLTEAKTVQVGLMSASPQGNGFLVSFENFKIETN